MIRQILSSNSSELPKKVRFKSCLRNEFGCATCDDTACHIAGNYDLDGWRYDTIVGYGPMGNTERVLLESGICLHILQCDFYTLEPPDMGPQAIL